MAETLDELGPVDWLVVEFPGPDFGKGQIAPFLEDLVKRDLIRVLDMVFLRKTEDGTLETAEISDLDASELGEVRMAEADLAMVLSEQDVMDLAETIAARPLRRGARLGEPVGGPVRRSRPQGRRPARGQRPDPDPGRHRCLSGRRRSRSPVARSNEGRNLTCHSQHDAGAGPPPPSAGPLSSPTGLTVAATAGTTAGTTADDRGDRRDDRRD